MRIIKNTAIIFIILFSILTIGIFKLIFHDVFHYYFNEWLNHKNQEELIQEEEYKLNIGMPKRLDNYTVNTKIHIDPKTKTFYFQMSVMDIENKYMVIKEQNIKEAERRLSAQIISNYCSISTINPLVKNGYMFAYAYKYIDETGNFKILNIIASQQDC